MSKTGQTFDEVGKNFFQLDSKPVTRVYADLEYLQDLKFGALLYGVTLEEEMRYIHSSLKRYNNRYDQLTAKYFGALKKTEADLVRLLQTPFVKDRICFLSPWTSVYYNLLQSLDMFQHHNQRLLEQNKKIQLDINISDVQYPLELQQYLSQMLAHQINIDVHVQQMPRYTADVNEYLSYDLLFLYDYGTFVNTFANPFVGEGKFTDTRIVAMPYIEEGLGHKPETYEDVLQSTERGLDIYCDFSFLRSNVILDKTETSNING